jgi:ubiquinone/menaquinone biosynthesis C-methylase UbiE
LASTDQALSTRGLYERWAPGYPPVSHNPLMRVEQQAMLDLWPDVAGRRTLDLACGTGRYASVLAEAQATTVIALDFSTAMLRQVTAGTVVCASMMQLPFVAGAFDVVISGLALGHATAVDSWMLEISRVLDPGGVLLYSDFHPEAARAGLTRSFKDARDCSYTVPHRCYDVGIQEQAAAQANLTIEIVREIRVGVELRETFPRSDEFYRRWHGLPLVLVVRARKRQR